MAIDTDKPEDLSWLFAAFAKRQEQRIQMIEAEQIAQQEAINTVIQNHQRRQSAAIAAIGTGVVSPIVPPEVLKEEFSPILMQSIVTPIAKTSDGELIRVSMIPWKQFLAELKKNPAFIYQIDYRKMEELIAASYDAAGFEEVTLTPRSGDDGRDVIAVKRGFYEVRFFDQVKKFKPDSLVEPHDIREMLGVLSMFPNTSKAFVTTTSDFAPTIYTNPEIQKFVPYRLELRNGPQTLEWLEKADSESSKPEP